MIKKLLLTIQKKSLGFSSKIKQNINNYNIMNYEPIFVVGAPRSGSTLFFQMLTNNYKVSYISNSMALFPKFMITINKLFRFIKKDHALKESDYGFIPGLQAPSEAGAIFRFYFDDRLNENKIKLIRGTFFELSKLNKSPLVSKNLYNSLRIEKILEVFPKAKFIIINRNILYNAQSLYQSRIKHFNDETTWFSVEPDGYKNIINKTPLYQVIWQVDKINKIIEQSLLDVNNKNKIFINYESFCENPLQILTKISHQFNLESTHNISKTLETNIKARNKISLSKKNWAALKKIYENEFSIIKDDL